MKKCSRANAPKILDVKVNYLNKDEYGTAVPIGGKFQIIYKYLINKPEEGKNPGDYGKIESVSYDQTKIVDGKVVDKTTEAPQSGGTFATTENVERVGDPEVKTTGAADEAVIVTKTETFEVKPRSNMRSGTGSIGFQIVVTDPQIPLHSPKDPNPQNGSKPNLNPAIYTTRDHDDKRIDIRKNEE